jgi:hypothetical protein
MDAGNLVIICRLVYSKTLVQFCRHNLKGAVQTSFDKLFSYMVGRSVRCLLQCGKCSENKVFNCCSVLCSAARADLQKNQQQGLFT